MNLSTEQKTNSPNRIDWGVVLFFVLAYAIGWGMIPILSAIARQSGLADWIALSRMAEAFEFGNTQLPVPRWLVYLITRFQDFAFSIAGVVMIATLYGRDGLRVLGHRLIKWRMHWRWYLFALLPVGLYLLATAISGALSSFKFNVNILGRVLFSAEAGIVVAFFLRGAMGEELGLRGFALPRLQDQMGPLRASVIVGVLWATWHIPVLLNQNLVSIIAFLLLAFMLSFIFTWLFNGSGGSLLPVMLFHAIQNSEEIFETIFPDLVGTDWELVSSLGLLVIGIVVAVILWRADTRKETQVVRPAEA